MSDRREDLHADCSRCFGLCCVAPAFSTSADFAINKPAGQPCPNLRTDFRCGIHDHLRQRGFPGCTVYDCFGAGQHVSQVSFGGRDWREHPDAAGTMFEVFAIVRQLHELLFYLAEALTLQPDGPRYEDLRLAMAQTERLIDNRPHALVALDVEAHRRNVNVLLQGTSERARASSKPRDRSGADLIGADLEGQDLSGSNFRGACLVGANLRRTDLTRADLTGADLRGADLSGADLRDSLFVTQSQLDAALGDDDTKLPPALGRPNHWLA